MSQSESSAARVLAVPEIVEAILLRTEPAWIIAAERTCRSFYEVAKTSPRIQIRLGFQSQPKIRGGIVAPKFNEALFWVREGNVVWHTVGKWQVKLQLSYQGPEAPKGRFYILHIIVTTRDTGRKSRKRRSMAEMLQQISHRSYMQMLLVSPTVQTHFILNHQHLPDRGAMLHDYRACRIQTYADLVRYIYDMEQTLATPFYKAWFDFWRPRAQHGTRRDITYAFQSFERTWQREVEKEEDDDEVDSTDESEESSEESSEDDSDDESEDEGEDVDQDQMRE